MWLLAGCHVRPPHAGDTAPFYMDVHQGQSPATYKHRSEEKHKAESVRGFSKPSSAFSLQIVKEYERAIIFRLGRIVKGGAKGPGRRL